MMGSVRKQVIDLKDHEGVLTVRFDVEELAWQFGACILDMGPMPDGSGVETLMILARVAIKYFDERVAAAARP